MSSEQQAVTVESIRDDLRGSILQIALFASAYSLEGQEREKEVGCMSADNLARFGVNCGLITPEEFHDWYGAIHNNQPLLGEVAVKYNKKKESANAVETAK